MLDIQKAVDVEKKILGEGSIMIKADRTGIIEYVNWKYTKLCEFQVHEIIGERMDALVHPDTPTTVYNHIWESLFAKKRTFAIFKNITKSGKYFWLKANFDFKVDEKTRELENIYAYYSKVSTEARQELDTLYKTIKSIEDHSGVDQSEEFLKGYLDDRGLTYQSLIEKYL